MFKFGEISSNTSELNKSDVLNKEIPRFDSGISVEDAKTFWDEMFYEPKDISIIDILDHYEDEFTFDDFDITDMNELLDNFELDTWNEFTTDEKINLVNELVDTISEKLGLEDIPEVLYYEDDPGNRGVYYDSFNVLGLNECLLDDPQQLVKTTAHELRHAYQHLRAESPQNYEDFLYRINLANYISPMFNDDGECILYTDYACQFVEAEARAFSNLFNREGAMMT